MDYCYEKTPILHTNYGFTRKLMFLLNQINKVYEIKVYEKYR